MDECMSYCDGRGRRKHLKPSISPTIGDIRQAAGIYEGEGWCNTQIATGHTGFQVGVGQKDRWLCDWMRERFGGAVGTYKSYKIDRKELNGVMHTWRICGARARGFALTIFQFLSPRRKEQIKAALARHGWPPLTK